MKHSLKLLSLFTLFSSSIAIADGWQAGLAYSHLTDDVNGTDIELGLAVASLGYEFKQGKWSIIPELKLGTGVMDDKYTVAGTTADLEVDRYFALSSRFQYQVSDKLYLYAAPMYANLKVSASVPGVSASDDEWDWGAGIGAGYKVSDNTDLELTYDNFDGTNILSAGMRYRF